MPLGTQIYYVTPQPSAPPSMLDRNIVLYVDENNWAVGHCTLSFLTGRGLCTLSDGIGDFAGFNARVDVLSLWDGVIPLNSSAYLYSWTGTYSFNPEQSRKR